MKLDKLIQIAEDKTRFATVEDYADYCRRYLEFIYDGLQAVIVSQNENKYRFFQYKEDGMFAVTRPINSELMLSAEEFDEAWDCFRKAVPNMRDIKNDVAARKAVNKVVYTCQQSIGATLDALPAGESNRARKLNGDLFERFIRRIIADMGIDVQEGTVKVPVMVDGQKQFEMAYQHDLILRNGAEVTAIGSVKTSSKDRLDKIFIDKFLYNKLTNMETPHFAVFLNDVQRKGKEPYYGVNSTFLTGHYKGYTVKLNPLDGVYYCDMRPVMYTDELLKQTIHTLDYLLVEDIWKF